jgi:hypothetical protein
MVYCIKNRATLVAWRADLNLRRYGDLQKYIGFVTMVAGEGFEPSKAEPGDLQSPPIGRSGNPPGFYGLRRLPY